MLETIEWVMAEPFKPKIKKFKPNQKEFRKISINRDKTKISKSLDDNYSLYHKFHEPLMELEEEELLKNINDVICSPLRDTKDKYLKSLYFKDFNYSHYKDPENNYSKVIFSRQGHTTKKSNVSVPLDSIRIPTSKRTLDHTIRQTLEAHLNRDFDTFLKNRENKKQELISKINTDIDINLLIANQGLGKTSSANDFRNLYGSKQAIIAFNDNKLAKQKFKENKHPSKFFIPGKDEFLKSCRISKEYHQTTYSEYDKVFHIDVIKTINNYPHFLDKKKDKLKEKWYHIQSIIKGKIHYDLLFLTKAKLDKELQKSNLNNSDILYIIDEYRKEDWLSFEDTKDKEKELFSGVGFGGAIYLKEVRPWADRIYGKILLLTTEDLPITHLRKIVPYRKREIVDIREVTPTKNVNLICCPDSLMSSKLDNKSNTVGILKERGYTVYSNGTKSVTNLSTFKGREIKSTKNAKWILALNRPHPKEVAPLIKELDLSYDEISIILLSDAINQFIGRWEGYRHKKYSSIDILIPKCYYNEILPRLKYYCNVERNLTSKYATKSKKELMKKNKVIEILHSLSILTKQMKHKDEVLYTDKVEKYLNSINGITDRLNKEKAIKQHLGSQYRYIKKYGLSAYSEIIRVVSNKAVKLTLTKNVFNNMNWFSGNEKYVESRFLVRINDG